LQERAGKSRQEKNIKKLVKLAKPEVYLKKLLQIERLLKKGMGLEGDVSMLGNFSNAPDSMPLAFYLSMKNNDFRNTVIDAVKCGGDTDSIATKQVI